MRRGTVALAVVPLAPTASTADAGWFSSPSLVDLTGDKRLEIVAPFYSTFVYSAGGRLLGKGTATSGRVYAPGVVADLDRDGRKEIVVTTFDHGIDVYRVPRSGTERLPWPTGRGGLLRGGT